MTKRKRLHKLNRLYSAQKRLHSLHPPRFVEIARGLGISLDEAMNFLKTKGVVKQ